MKFNYQARTSDGQIRAGAIEASSKETAISLLQKYGLYVTFLENAQKAPILVKKITLFERVSAKDRVLFSRQLSIMFSSNVPLVESLRTLASQTKKAIFKEAIMKISEEVEGGTSLSLALAKYPKIFSSFYVAMVRSGEVSGQLSATFNYLADSLESNYHMTSRIKGAMMYPAVVLVMAVSVLALMFIFIIPSLSQVLEQQEQELPAITKMLMALSQILVRYGWLVFLGFSGLIFFLIKNYKSRAGKIFFDKAVLRFPLVGPLLKMIYLSRFAENLSTLISGGLPITQAIDTTADIISNSVYKAVIFKASDEVRKGEAISKSLSCFPELFPPFFTQMAVVGERTGSLDKTLSNLAKFYQKEIDRTINSLLGILEPLLIVFLGLIVGGMMAAMLLPLYQTGGM
ncbi:MAG: type II secretion system F family protein [bacterium]